MYEEITKSIRVKVEPTFLEDESEPKDERFVWSYRVTIENKGSEAVQLLSRHWRIIDSNGHVRELRGAGVIGEQPVIEPGRIFQYTSGAPLETPSGVMSGSYRMRGAAGENFDVGIPMFALDSPYDIRRVH